MSDAKNETGRAAIEYLAIESLIPYARNSRTHSGYQVGQIAASIREFGFTNPVLVDEEGGIIAGHGRVQAAQRLGMKEVPCIRLLYLTPSQKRAYVIADNKLALNAGWDDEMLRLELADLGDSGYDLSVIGFDADELAEILGEELEGDPDGAGEGTATASLSDRFLIPPFSVLNAREGTWQERKRAWLALGIRSELGRGSDLLLKSEQVTSPGLNYYRDQKSGKQRQHVAGVLMTSDSGNDPRYYAKKQEAERRLGRELTTEEFQRDHYTGPDSYASGTSIFDPVLCELVYRWFSPLGGTVLDPFAGGSVRGIVASRLGRRYVGHELREEQVAANRAQGSELCADDDLPPVWIHGDSRRIDETCADVDADLIFSCPPYADLEVYSDDARDLSTMPYRDFLAAYREIIAKACARLRPDRFACFVVGEVRGRKGGYYNFVGDTIQAFRDAGLDYYNEAILVTALGSMPIRVAKQFTASRKVGKTHQNVLVFVKGDGKRAAAACGQIDVALPDDMTEEAAA